MSKLHDVDIEATLKLLQNTIDVDEISASMLKLGYANKISASMPKLRCTDVASHMTQQLCTSGCQEMYISQLHITNIYPCLMLLVTINVPNTCITLIMRFFLWFSEPGKNSPFFLLILKFIQTIPKVHL